MEKGKLNLFRLMSLMLLLPMASSQDWEKTYQVDGVVDDIAANYWVLQSEMGLFKFKLNPDSKKSLKTVRIGDRVSVFYRAEVVRIFLLKERKDESKETQRRIILDDRAFYEA